jgi:hypothetical protein
MNDQSLYDAQAEAWVTFDEDDACATCGAQVTEFNQVLHYRWHKFSLLQQLEDLNEQGWNWSITWRGPS